MTQNFNKSNMKTRRRSLRNQATPAEQKLWQELKGKQIMGVKFRRQYSIDQYVLDFYAPECKLAIELDGETHYTTKAIKHDAQRTHHIEGFGIKIIRFTNNDVFCNIDGVLQVIEMVVLERL